MSQEVRRETLARNQIMPMLLQLRTIQICTFESLATLWIVTLAVNCASIAIAMVSGKFHRHPPRDAILDPQFLRDQLEISERHLAGFYHSLHRLDYPVTTAEFVAQQYPSTKYDDLRRSDGISVAKKDGGKDDLGDQGGQGLVQGLGTSSPVRTIMSTKNKVQLPKRFLEFLKSYTGNTLTSRVHSVHNSANTLTTKLVIELHDGMLVESVIMRYDKKTKIPRASLCVSSQVGCAMGCTFCATGTMGKIGNLGVAEILEQIIHANRILRKEPGCPQVRNVVFMGMGEVRWHRECFLALKLCSL